MRWRGIDKKKKGLLQHRCHWLSGDPDRPFLCRSNNYLHLSPHRECRYQSRGCGNIFFFFKQKTAYEMSIGDWSSDVCSSDLQAGRALAELEERSVGGGEQR